MTKSNRFMQVKPDSQFFSDLNQLLEYAKARGDVYLQIAIKNTMKKGYTLTKKLPAICKDVHEDIDRYYEEDT